jgi:iron complex outermembrane receptor protein
MEYRWKRRARGTSAALLTIACAWLGTPALGQERPQSLAPVTVTASPYNVSTASTATRTEQAISEVPLSVDVVPRHLIDDQMAFDLEEVLRNVGVYGSDTSGWGAKSFYIRGFRSDNYYLDGVRQANYVQLDPALVQQVDVLRGSSAGMYGRIEPGGIVNIVTVMPSTAPRLFGELTLGSYDTVRAVADATGPIAGESSLLYRVTAAYQYNNSFRDTVYSGHFTIAPTLSWIPTRADRVDVQFIYQKFTDTVDYGLPLVPVLINSDGVTAQNRISAISNRVYVGPDDNQVRPESSILRINWTHAFEPNWNLRATIGGFNVRQPGTEGGFGSWQDQPDTGWGAVQPQFANIYVGNPSNFYQKQWFGQADLIGRFQALGVRHELLLSAEVLRWSYQYAFWGYQGAGLNPIDVFAPVYQSTGLFYTSPDSIGPTVQTNADDYWWSVTAQDMIQIGSNLRVLLGIRYDHSSVSNSGSYDFGFGPGTFGIDGVKDANWSPRVGASYDVLPWLAAYGSYSTAYGSNDFSVLYDGSISKSQTSRQWEIGVKGHWSGDRLVGRLTYFNLEKNGVTVDVPAAALGDACIAPDPSAPMHCLVQTGKQASHGIELLLQGRLSESLSINAAYQYIHAQVLDGGDWQTPFTVSFPVNARLPDVPYNSGALWLQYRNPTGWGAGLGVTAMSNRPYDYTGTLYLPGFATVDAALSYGWQVGKSRLNAQLNLKNLTNNEHAYDIGWAGTGVLPAEPRSAYATLSVSL